MGQQGSAAIIQAGQEAAAQEGIPLVGQAAVASAQAADPGLPAVLQSNISVGASSSAVAGSPSIPAAAAVAAGRRGDVHVAAGHAGSEAGGGQELILAEAEASAVPLLHRSRDVAEEELQADDDMPEEVAMDVEDEDSAPEDAEEEDTTEEGETLAEEEEEEEQEHEHQPGAADNMQPSASVTEAPQPPGAAGADGAVADLQPAAIQETATSSDQEQGPVWSAMVTIDRDIPFPFVWQGVQSSVTTVLDNVLHTWQRAGWNNVMEMELTVRRSVRADGSGPIARGLHKADAERVVKMLEGVVTCSVQVDHAGAAAARAIREASPVDDAQLRARLQARVRALQGQLSGSAPEIPAFREARESLQRMDTDLADDENWRRRAQALERHLRRLERVLSSRRGEGLDLIAFLMMAARENRRKVITVDRSNILTSALKPVIEASPEELRPGKVLIRYLGEEGEDGQGGGGVTRAFLSDAGSLLAEPQLGLLLPAPGGHMQLSPMPGFFALGAEDLQSMSNQAERWCRFFGRLLGMAVAHEAPIGVRLAPPLCKQLHGVEPCFEDLQFVPGLNEGGAGWYTSIRNMLGQRSFPSLEKSEEAVEHMEEEVVRTSLLGLEAVMPSRAQQSFESLAMHVSGSAHCPSLWEGAAKVARSLLQKARTRPQRDLVLNGIKELVRGVLMRAEKSRCNTSIGSCSGACVLSSELSSELKSLHGALASAGSGPTLGRFSEELADAMAELDRLLQAVLQASDEVSETTGSQSLRKRDLSPAEPELEDGMPSIQPAKRAKPSTAMEEEHTPTSPAGPPIDDRNWETSSVVDGFTEDSGVPSELSAEKLPAFAEAVTRKALVSNLQPHLDIIVKEFRSVVPKRLGASLTWQQVQDRISGKRMDSASFVQEWRDRTTYSSCEEKDAAVQLWWEFVSDQLDADLYRLFTWCTGFAAIPVTPWKFQIKVVDDTRRCPTINTCMTDDSSAANRGVKMPTIYLPAYDSKATLAQKISWSLAGASSMSLY